MYIRALKADVFTLRNHDTDGPGSLVHGIMFAIFLIIVILMQGRFISMFIYFKMGRKKRQIILFPKCSKCEEYMAAPIVASFAVDQDNVETRSSNVSIGVPRGEGKRCNAGWSWSERVHGGPIAISTQNTCLCIYVAFGGRLTTLSAAWPNDAASYSSSVVLYSNFFIWALLEVPV